VPVRVVISRRAWLGGLGAVLLGCDAMQGCEDGGSAPSFPTADGTIPADPGSPAPPGTATRAPSPIGYSNVATLNASEARMIVEAGLTLMQAELAAFSHAALPTEAEWARVKGAVAVARAGGATVLLTLVNWNGAAQRAQSTAWFTDLVTRAIQEIGPAGVWLEGVSEPDRDGKSVEWVRVAVDRWPGTDVVNGPDGRGPAAAHGLLDWHYCDTASLLQGVQTRGDRVHSTDCTAILASRLPETVVKQVTRDAARLRRMLILYDTSPTPGANPDVIRWMGEALRA
jgi:hypothetical protein